MSLQITSMADIFTILLVFLLKGISTDALAIAPSAGTRLPLGHNSTTIPDTALQVELGEAGILIEKEFVAGYRDFEGALSKRLEVERKKQDLIASKNDAVKNDGQVLILSDSKVPFSTLKRVLKALSAYGYSDVKFAVVRP